MHEVVIADTSCLIILSNINELDHLQKLYGKVTTTHEIAKEFGEILPDWFIIKSPTDPQKQQLLELQVDKVEASAIALAMETPQSLIILDDLKARVVAKQLGILITGTIGIIVKAKLNGTIASIKPLIKKIRQTNFRLSQVVEEIALKEAGE